MGSFNREGLEKAIDMYADDVQFEDVTFAHKISGKAKLTEAGYPTQPVSCHHARDDVAQQLVLYGNSS